MPGFHFIPILHFTTYIVRTRGIIPIIHHSITSFSVDLSTIISPFLLGLGLILLFLGLGMCPAFILYPYCIHLYCANNILLHLPLSTFIFPFLLGKGSYMTFIGVRYMHDSDTIVIMHVSNTCTFYILYLYLSLQVDGYQSAMYYWLIATCRSINM